MTVAENLRFFADIYGVAKSEREQRSKRLLEFSRLSAFVKRRASALSGGMKQKLALACTLIHTPKLLILDEPTTGVDPISRAEFWAILADLQKQGVTILVTTPYMDEAERCTRITLMYQGRTLATGTPAQIAEDFPDDLIQIYTSQPQECATLLRHDPRFTSVHLYGDRIHATGKSADFSPQVIEKLLQEAKLPFKSVQLGKPNLEDAFVYFVQRSDEAEKRLPK
ncbi:MAG: ABC transporter ATP-binding protein [bacterium]